MRGCARIGRTLRLSHDENQRDHRQKRESEHVNSSSPQSEQMFGALRGMFLASGSGPGLADQRAYASMFGIVQRQAAMRAFVDVFYLLTLAFLAMIPLILIMRKPKGAADPGAAAH